MPASLVTNTNKTTGLEQKQHQYFGTLESASQHFVEQEDGQLTTLTPTGVFTIKRLRLNRSQLIVARQRRQQQVQVERLLQRYQELTALQAQINIQLTNLAMEQQVLLKEQRKWLRTLLNRINQ